MNEWCDVEDQDGIWRIGHVIDRTTTQNGNILTIRIDGQHPGYDTFYCDHSKKLHPVRTHTIGFNSFTNHHPASILRQPLKLDELKLNHNRLSLIGRMQNLMESTQENIKIFMRTQLLVIVDKIMKTPFALINNIKMCDLWINKIFIAIINFYIKLLDSSKKFLPLIDQDNKIAKELLMAMFQFSLINKLIIGSHKNSKPFFEDPTNLAIKKDGFVDCFIMSDNGILPFRIFFKNVSLVSLSKLDSKLTDAVFQVLDFFLDICQGSKGSLFQSKFSPQTKSVTDQIINFLKVFANFSESNLKYLKLRAQTVNRLQTLQLKLKPKKTWLLRNQIFQQEKEAEPKQKPLETNDSKANISSEQIQSLKQRVQKLQNLLSNFTNPQNTPTTLNQSPILRSVQNLGQQNFLYSLNWALNCGDLEVCKRLVNWRQNLLKLAKIAGWEVALQVGIKTLKKTQITHQDIISVNTQLIKKNYAFNPSIQQKL